MADQGAVMRRIQSANLTGPRISPNPTRPVINKNVNNFARKGKDASNYYAWQTASGKKPDFGKGQAGPGTPYREILTNYKIEQVPDGPKINRPPDVKLPKSVQDEAIRRRLTNTPEKRDPAKLGYQMSEAKRLAMQNRKPDLNAIGKIVAPPRNDVPRPGPVF